MASCYGIRQTAVVCLVRLYEFGAIQAACQSGIRLPYAVCRMQQLLTMRMPYAVCRMPYAAATSYAYAVCRMPYAAATRYAYGVWRMAYGICSSYSLCRMQQPLRLNSA